MNFEIVSRKFVFTFRHDPNIVSAPTLGENKSFFLKKKFLFFSIKLPP